MNISRLGQTLLTEKTPSAKANSVKKEKEELKKTGAEGSEK